MGMVVGPKPIDTNGLILYFDGSNPNNYSNIAGIGTQWIDPYKKHSGMWTTLPSEQLTFDYNYNSVIFNGWSDYLRIIGKPELYLNDTGFSIHSWICAPTSYGSFAADRSFINIPGCFSLMLWAGSYNEFRYYGTNGNIDNIYYGVPFKSWRLLSINAVKSGSNLSIGLYDINLSYTNSLGNKSYNLSTFSDYNNRDIFIGSPSSPFGGHIGMVAMYNRPFSSSDFRKLYDNTKDRFKIPKTSNMIKDNVVLYLDAGDPSSYPGTGNIWYDLSGNNNHATLIGDPIPSYSSEKGGSIYFNGSNYANISHSPTLNLSQNSYFTPYTIILTFKPLATVYNNTLLAKGSQYALGYTQNSYVTGTWGLSSAMYNNTWYNSCYQYNGLHTLVFSDGHYHGAANRVGILSSPESTSDLRIAQYCGCMISQIIMYNRALSPAEILQNYNAWSAR